MTNKFYFQIIQIFFYVICFQLINIVDSKIYYTYPYGITLSNKNIFIIHQLGVDVIDPLFTKISKKVMVFTEDEKISTEDELSKVEIKYKNQYIIVLMKDNIYIFNDEGDLLCKSDDKITDDDSIEYYTLVPLEIENKIYYFIVGFFDQNNFLNLLLYKYILDDNIIKNIKTKKETKFKNNYSFINKGLACEYISYSSDNILTCFFIYKNYRQYLTTAFYTIYNELINDYNYLGNPIFEINNVKFIKSATNNDKNLAFICFYDAYDNRMNCMNFDISYPKFYNNFFYNKNCRNKIYGLKVNYIYETKKISFSCIDDDGSIQADFFNNKLVSSYETSIKQFTSCSDIYGHSILYLSDINIYYVLSDVICSNTQYLVQELESDILKDISNISNITYYEEEKEEEEKEEEEKEEEEKEEEEETAKKEIETELIKCDEKCKYCDQDSINEDLCIQCNEENNYFPIINPPSKKIDITSKYKECVNNKTKPTNFYFNKNTKYYEICHENCATCEYGGDGNVNNCTSCETTHIFKPDIISTTNCVKKCDYYYYYDKYWNYCCSQEEKCPDDFPLLVKEKLKCTNDCKNENPYLYYYNGECLKECPEKTNDNNDYICKDMDLNKCFLQKKHLYLKDNYTEKEIEYLVKEYCRDFNYTNNHVTLYKNKLYTITIYKNGACISSLNLATPEINFGGCYEKVLNNYKIDGFLIIAIITKIIKGKKTSSRSLSYSLFDPKDGKELETDTICENEVIIMKETFLNKLEESDVNMTTFLFLTGQDINLLNKSSLFYTDICYHCNLPVKKDVPLKDRISLYFPNIVLCESSCIPVGVNLTELKAICECKYNSKNKNLLEDNLMYQTGVGEIRTFLSNTNIEVITCYKDIFKYKYFISNVGGFMILFCIALQIIFTIIYYKKGMYPIRKYIFDITSKYITYLQKDNNISNNLVSQITNKNIKLKNAPPKKKYSMKQLKSYNLINQNFKTKSRKKKTKSNRKVNFVINQYKYNDSNSIKVGNFNENNPNSNNVLMGNYPTIYIDKINLNNINNKNIILERNLLSNKKMVEKNKYVDDKKDNQNDFIINLKNNLEINIEEYLDTDKDDMDYEDAIKKDKRKFGEYFKDKLKTNQILVNTFYVDEALRPRTIKLLLLILNFDLYFVINGLFFNEEYISDVFHSNEEESFSDFLFRFTENCFYTTFVGVFVNYIIDCFFVEEKKIKGILKREKNNLFVLNYEITQLIKDILRRYNYFIVISFFITVFTWYYISCFNNIYPYTKGEWIKTSILIIIVMQILSVLVSLLEAIIRYFSFKYKSEKLYKILHCLS